MRNNYYKLTMATKKTDSFQNKSRGQGMVEFALVLPLLLLVMFGLMEAGRLLFTYSAVYTASREAARYGSASGNAGGYIAYYQDCSGMRAAARRVGSLAGIRDADVTITYDQGTITNTLGSCPIGSVGPDLTLGNRVTVRVSSQYQPILPLAGFPPIPITSTSSRTILKNVSIQGTPSAPGSSLPQVYFEEAEHSIEEGDFGETQLWSLNVRLSQVSDQNVTVNFSVSGSANPSVDFTLNRTSPLVIPAGQEGMNINITVLGDDIDEYNESVVFTIDSTVNAQRGSPYIHSTTIVDDDSEPNVTFSNTSQSVLETNSSILVNVEVVDTMGNSTYSGKEIWVPYSLDGTAIEGQDFTSAPNPLVIAPGMDSASMVFPLNNDLIYEDEDSVIVDMGTPVNANKGAFTVHTALILDDELPPLVAFDLESQATSEIQGSAIVSAHLHDSLGNPVSSELQVTAPLAFSGSALAEIDYTVSAAELVFPPGSTSAEATVTVLADDLPEVEETVIIDMGVPENAELGVPSRHTITITPDALVFFTSEAQSVQEGAQDVEVELTLVPAQTEEVRVAFTLSGTAAEAEDFTLTTGGEVVFPPGSTSAVIGLSLIDDVLDEYDETISINLDTPLNAGLGTPEQHTLTIVDNDLAPLVYFESASQTVEEDAGTLTALVMLSAASTKPITASLQLGGSAYLLADYSVNPANQVVFQPGSTSAQVSVNIVNDTLAEPNETVILTLSQPLNADFGTPFSHVITILINDQPTCNIFTGNELAIGPENKKVAWTLSNLGQDTLILNSLTISWPTNASNAPKLDFIKFNGTMIWDGNIPQSPATISGNWIGFDSYRVLTSTPAEIATYFTRTLLPGNYAMTLVFYNVERGTNCSPVVKSATVH